MRLGIDQAGRWQRLLEGKRAGLITNPTGVDSALQSDIDRLRPYLACLFGPEHGIRAVVQDELAVEHGRDERTGLVEYSLFGSVTAPTAEMLKGLDLLIFDIQDVGVRFYTYGATMALSMRAAAQAGIGFVVLDRPNPLGSQVEGLLRGDGFESFLSLAPVCTRHGLTMGELAGLMKERMGLKLELTVIPMEGYSGSPLEEDGRWVPPSPNMPSISTVRVYPGTCLVEGTSISEGRGTAKPFEWIGAPWIDGQRLADQLNERGLPGCRFRPVSFTPLAFKHAGQLCQGVQVHVTDHRAFTPVRMGIALVRALQESSGSRFTWRYLPEYGHYMTDLLHGDDSLRRGAPLEEIEQRMLEDEYAFRRASARFRIYGG